MICSALLSGCVKKISYAGLAAEEIVFFQGIMALLVLLPWILKDGRQVIIPKNTILIVSRSFVGLIFLYLFYLSIRLTPLVNAVLLKNTTPLFIPIIMAAVFRKKITLKTFLIMLAGFIGVALVLDPGKGVFNFGDITALTAGLVSAVGILMVGRLEDKGESVRTMMLYYLVITILVTGVLSVPGWKTPHGIQWIYLAVTGVLYALYQVLVLDSLKLASPIIIAPFIYLGVVFSGVVDWVGWKQVPSHITVLGAFIVVASAVLSAVHKSKHK